MAEKGANDDVRVDRTVQSSILEAIKGRVARLNVSAELMDATDMYGKNTPGDGYAKNTALQSLEDVTTLPAFNAGNSDVLGG